MVQVTQAAKEALLRTKQDASIDTPNIGLRLMFGADGRLCLVPDREKAGDQVVKHEDATVLLIDPEISALAVIGRVVDCRRTKEGGVRFYLRSANPDERRDFSAA